MNPLTWTTDTVLAGHEANLGSVTFGAWVTSNPASPMRCVKTATDCYEVRSPNYDFMPLAKATTTYDYSFYHMNLRQNVQARVDAFLTNQAEQVENTVN